MGKEKEKKMIKEYRVEPEGQGCLRRSGSRVPKVAFRRFIL